MNDFVRLLNVGRSANYTFANYKARFGYFARKLKLNGYEVAIPHTLAAQLLIHNAIIGPSQNFGLMIATANAASDVYLTYKLGRNVFLFPIKYGSVAVVVGQYENQVNAIIHVKSNISSVSKGSR